MPDDTTLAQNPDDELAGGLLLVEAAGSSGDWKAVADWLAGHPAHAAEVLQFVDDRGKIARRLPPAESNRFGKYERRELIGRGGMADVYRAFDPVLNQPRALKVLRPDSGFTAVDVARFRYEAQVVASLAHPNVVTVHDYGEAESGPYLVMPLMTAGNLADWLKKQPDHRTDPKTAAELVRDIALGVHHAHEQGLIHRDLKPGNVLMDDSGTPKVADFGLARRTDATATTGIAGTPAYMAPEQARGEKVLTTAVDIHALGAILFELLTGQPPYGGGNIASVLRRVLDDPPPAVRQLRRDAPADLEAICRKCLEKQPADRYRSAEELADDLGRFLRGEPVLARRRGLFGEVAEAFRHPAEVQSYATLPLVAFASLHHPAVHLVIMALILAGASPTWTFGVMVYHLAAWIGQVWLFSARRHRELNAPERRSNMAHLAMWMGAVTLLPVHLTLFGLDVLPLYPVLNALSATGLFISGGLYAGRMYVLALLMMSQNLILPFLPFWAWPLLHGVAGGTIFALFGAYVWRVHEAARAEEANRSQSPHPVSP